MDESHIPPDNTVIRVDEVVPVLHLENVPAFVLGSLGKSRVHHGGILRGPVNREQIVPIAGNTIQVNQGSRQSGEPVPNRNINVVGETIPVAVDLQRVYRSILFPGKGGNRPTSPVDTVLDQGFKEGNPPANRSHGMQIRGNKLPMSLLMVEHVLHTDKAGDGRNRVIQESHIFFQDFKWTAGNQS